MVEFGRGGRRRDGRRFGEGTGWRAFHHMTFTVACDLVVGG